MSFGPSNDYPPLTEPAYPPTDRTGTLDYEAPSDLTAYARNQSLDYHPQTDQALLIHEPYSWDACAGLGEG